MPKLLEGLKTWLQSMNDAWASDVAVPETLEKLAEPPAPDKASSRLQSGAIVGIFTLLVFYFLYFASPILIPIITALLLSMLLAPFVRLLELAHVPRALGSLIVVVAAVGALFGIAASLRGPVQSWLTEPQRFSRLEERLRPITAPFERLQHATEQLEKATAPRDGPPIQKVEVTRPGLSGLLSTGSGHATSTITAVIGLLYFFLVSGRHILEKTGLGNSCPQGQETRRRNCQKHRDRYLFLPCDGDGNQYSDRFNRDGHYRGSGHSRSPLVGYTCCGT